MAKILSVFSHKGGVGKTTLSVNLSAAYSLMLSHANFEKPGRVLLIDLDEQGHSVSLLSKGGVEQSGNVSHGPMDNIAGLLSLNSDTPVRKIIQTSQIPVYSHGNLDYIPTNRAQMTKLENNLQSHGSAALYRLEKILLPIRDYYEYIIIDNPPGMSYVNLNSLAAATHVIIVTQLETPAVSSLNNAVHTVNSVIQKVNPSLVFSGILPNMCDFRIKEHSNFLISLQNHYREMVLPAVSRRADITYATSRGVDIFSYRPPRSKNEIESSNNSVKEMAKVAVQLRKRMDTWEPKRIVSSKGLYVEKT